MSSFQRGSYQSYKMAIKRSFEDTVRSVADKNTQLGVSKGYHHVDRVCLNDEALIFLKACEHLEIQYFDVRTLFHCSNE